MKKIFVFVFLVSFMQNELVFGVENYQTKEVHLDTMSNMMELQKKKTYNEDLEEKEFEQKEERQQQLYNQGQDYMYRIQQQMGAPTRMNQFGGYSF